MKTQKMIDGCLPCQCGDTCPLSKPCGGDWDWRQPNTKKLACLLSHIETLSKELWLCNDQNGKTTMGDYAYQMFWTMHNEIKDTIDLLCKWEEPKNDRQNFLECYNFFCRCYSAYELTFFREAYERLRIIARCLENSFE